MHEFWRFCRVDKQYLIQSPRLHIDFSSNYLNFFIVFLLYQYADTFRYSRLATLKSATRRLYLYIRNKARFYVLFFVYLVVYLDLIEIG